MKKVSAAILFAILLFRPDFLLGQSENQKYAETDAILNTFFNNFDSVEKNRESRDAAFLLIQKYPDDPYVYDIWASIEWTLIGHELSLDLSQNKNISDIEEYKDRAKKYQETLETGLKLTENKTDSKSVFARSALLIDHGKFFLRFENTYKAMGAADKKTADALGNLKNILEEDPNFCPAYFFLGVIRFQFSETGVLNKMAVRLLSKSYAEIYKLDSDFFNKQKAIKWLEKFYQCGYQEIWFKKVWIESAFALADAYEQYRKDLDIYGELPMLQQEELPVLENLHMMFPQNKSVNKKLSEINLRIDVLRRFIFSKK